MPNRSKRLQTIEAVQECLVTMKRGEGRPLDEVFRDLKERFAAKTWK